MTHSVIRSSRSCCEGQSPNQERDMDEDKQAAKDLRDREEELSVGVRALTRRLKQLEARGAELQPEIQALYARQDAGDEVFEDQLTLLDKIAELDEDKRGCLWGLYILTADAIGTEHTAADVASWCQHAIDLGARHPRIGLALLRHLLHVRKVPNAPFRERLKKYLDKGGEMAPVVTLVHRHLKDVERETGEEFGSANLMHHSHPQPRVLERLLGMQTTSYGGDKKPSLCLFISYELALALGRAFDLTPHQSGT